MIVRPPQHWFRRFFDWHGSVLPLILSRLLLNLIMGISAVLFYQNYQHLSIHITTAPFSLLGVTIAIFLGFRNNTSYARFTEARQLWGSLLISSRSLLRQVKSVFGRESEEVLFFGELLMAFAWSLKHQLRNTDGRDDIARLVPPRFRQEVLDSPLQPSRLLLCMGLWLGEQRAQGRLSDMLYDGIDRNLNQLSQVLGGCERIASTPIPFAYGLILHRTVYLYCTLLPFALVPDLRYMAPLVSVFVSYTFLSLEALAEELEDPFGTAANDLPLDAICTSIEINLKEMNDITPLPAKCLPDQRFNLL